MLDKRLKLGGLQVGGPRTMQNPARFRVADNVYQTLDDYMVPRFGNEDLFSSFASDETIIAVANYKLKPFIITQTGDNRFHFYYNSTTELPTPTFQANVTPPAPGDVLSLGIQFLENQGCLYFNMPILGLLKFDGTHVIRAGVPTPWINSLQYSDAGATFIRVIQHHIDFQGNVVNSGYVQFPATPSGSNVTIQTDQSALDMVQSFFAGLYSNVVPKGRQIFDNMGNSHDAFYVVASATTVVTGGIRYTTGGNHQAVVGAYILVTADYQPSYLSGFGIETLATAFKVSAVTATTVTLQYADARYLDTNRNWHTDTALSGLPTGANVFSNMWQSVWTSNAATGNYVWKAIIKAPFLSTTSQTTTVNVSSPTVANSGADKNAFNLAGNLGDIYDVTSLKFPFPCFQEDLSSLSFCTYGSLAVISQTETIQFSDVSLGGNFEMTSGLSNIIVGGGDDGPVQGVQATPDFMLVSRQFKNYYVSGNLPTANYRVQPISQTSLGIYSNESTVAVLDKVIFVNKTGVWALYSGGRCEEISVNIRGLFTTFSDTKVFAEELAWNIDDLPTYITPNQWFEGNADDAFNKWIKVRFDNCRNLVAICAPSLVTGDAQILILNMSNGEFYTWRGLLYGFDDVGFKDMCFIEGNYYVTNNHSLGHGVRKELKTGSDKYDYRAGLFPPLLITTWFTAGEPSLEKKTQQIKMWGTIEGEVQVEQYQDWKPTATFVDTYTNNDDPDLFSHKQRLNQVNALALSVSMKFIADRAELEGLELEFEPFQMGMKR